jgi:O-acetyl-ADP-ribose deacetylase (regulator of RNase III)
MDIVRTDNVYLAMWAMLLAVRLHNQRSDRPIHIVACPGLGTATGRMPFAEAARQMALAYRHFLSPPQFIDWSLATDRQLRIRYGGSMGFDFPPETEI